MKLFATTAAALLLCSTGAFAQTTIGLLGGNIASDAPTDHLMYGPAIDPGLEESGSESGAWGEISIWHDFGTYSIGLSYQQINVDRGQPYSGTTEPPELGIDGRIIDIAYARPFGVAGMDASWSLGIRHGEFDVTAGNFSDPNGPRHEFSGTGLRLGIAAAAPINTTGLSWFTEAGLSILDGEIETSPRGSWICTD